ncbi:MAG: glycosyltransferase [Candidatus Hecatellaceae archaeon]
MSDKLVPHFEIMELGDAHVTVMTFNPVMATSWILLHRDLSVNNHKAIFYATTEGIPVKRHVHAWMIRDCEFIANSNFTAEMMMKAGLRVKDVVLHGVNISEVDLALKQREVVRRKLESKLNASVIYGCVASSHVRKGLDHLIQAWLKVKKQCSDAALYIASTSQAAKRFQGVPGCLVEPLFGKLTRIEVLALISSFDYLVHPALSEGFGLPVLEANACKVPSIHVAMPPLIEFSTSEVNFQVPFTDVNYVDLREGVEYAMHEYSVDDLANAMIEAYEVKAKHPSEYEDRCVKARENAEGLNIDEVYSKLLSHLGA